MTGWGCFVPNLLVATPREGSGALIFLRPFAFSAETADIFISEVNDPVAYVGRCTQQVIIVWSKDGATALANHMLRYKLQRKETWLNIGTDTIHL